MHLPYIIKTLGNNVTLVPIMVGQIDQAQIKSYGVIFAEYLKDENTFFVISSDFCHWGQK